jgi:glutamate-ammonia-ligase adenylyltransferase
MQIPTLVGVLDHPHLAAEQLQGWKLRDIDRGRAALLALADCGLTLDLLAALCEQLGQHLPHLAEPDEVLDALRRFLLASRSPLALAALFQRDPAALPMLLNALSLGESWWERLIDDPEAFDRLRITGGQPLARTELVEEVGTETASLTDERAIAAALTRFNYRERLRIAYGDVTLRHKVELVCEQLTYLAEALIEAALAAALDAASRKVNHLHREPGRSGEPPRISVIALGRLGGREMDYGNEIELLLVHDAPAPTEAARKVAQESCERVAKYLVKLLAAPLFRVSLVSLPDSGASAVTHTADDTILGFDSFGRTWHRQAMITARPIAGDVELGKYVLGRLAPWIFRRYLNQADETGIRALQRRLLRHAEHSAASPDIEEARGGLIDIEGVVQFLQLLAGGDQPGPRAGGTLAAIASLEQATILTPQERTLLEQSYLWLRRVRHRLQVLAGPDVESLPVVKIAAKALAQSLGLGNSAELTENVSERLSQTWELLAQLLGSAFAGEPPAAVVDLLLDPTPDAAEAAAALTGYGFENPAEAATTLQSLAREPIPFVSTRRCRHYLALIADRLLQTVAVTPDPDRTLSDLARVSDSLGSKGVLWQLFHAHTPSLQLYVRLCAASPYLSGILTTNPGMLDDLVDSLQLDRLPTRDELARTLAELSRGTEDVLPILHDLKNSAHLRIGVRDILGKEPIDATHAALADVAEFCLAQVIEREYAQLIEKHGEPTLGPGPFEGERCRLVVLGLGKLGGREPNYHSNVEVAFLYEAEGTTRPAPRSRQQPTTNNHFFTQLAQRVLKEMSQLTPKGRLGTVDVMLRPIGVGGAMALPLADFANHFLAGAATLWQWQALCQARPVFGEPPIREAAANLLRQVIEGRAWSDADRIAILDARFAQERGAAELNLKRARGGTLDIEFLVQRLQLQHAGESPAVLVPATQQALAALAAAGHLDRDDAEFFAESYRFLRRVESGLRLLNTSARHDLPHDPIQLGKLALLLGQPNGDTIRDRAIILLAENRRRFERIVGSR